MKDVDVVISREDGGKYGYSVYGNAFGFGSSDENKEEIIKGIRDYIKQEEKFYDEKIRVKRFENKSGLDITIADLKGEGKLSGWF